MPPLPSPSKAPPKPSTGKGTCSSAVRVTVSPREQSSTPPARTNSPATPPSTATPCSTSKAVPWNLQAPSPSARTPSRLVESATCPTSRLRSRETSPAAATSLSAPASNSPSPATIPATTALSLLTARLFSKSRETTASAWLRKISPIPPQPSKFSAASR